ISPSRSASHAASRVSDATAAPSVPHSSFAHTPVSALPGAPALWLYTLGVFQVLLYVEADRWVDLTDAHLWEHGRAHDLALLLLLRGRPLARAEAAATLWPEAESRHRGRLLRNALWNLRRALSRHASILQRDGSATTTLSLQETPYTLSLQVRATPTTTLPHLQAPTALVAGSEHEADPERLFPPKVSARCLRFEPVGGDVGRKSVVGRVWCDVWAFEEAATRAHEAGSLQERLTLGQAALDLYSGPFLAHRQAAWAGERQSRRQTAQTTAQALDWSHPYRTRAQAQWMRLVVERATDLRRIGEREQALDLLLQVVAQDALQSEAARRAMILLAELDRTQEALGVYERCRRAFRDAYGGGRGAGRGAEPAALRRLASELRAGRVMRTRVDSAPRPSSGVYPRPQQPDATPHPHALRYGYGPDSAYSLDGLDDTGDADGVDDPGAPDDTNAGWMDIPMTNPAPRRARW
ncbi:MAG: AfsR/SARP family transcriptional regulator, partial [Ktedonobacterales bacterium]